MVTDSSPLSATETEFSVLTISLHCTLSSAGDNLLCRHLALSGATENLPLFTIAQL